MTDTTGHPSDVEDVRRRHLDWIFSFDRERGAGHRDLEAELGRFYARAGS